MTKRFAQDAAEIEDLGGVFEVRFKSGNETICVVMRRSTLATTLMRASTALFWAMPAQICRGPGSDDTDHG